MTPPVAQAGMLIRRPVDEVFQAFTEPGVAAWFWFSHGDHALTPGATVVWTWGMYGVSTTVRVRAVERDRRILIDWDVDDDPTEVEWLFEPRGAETWVQVFNRGFPGTDDGVARALDAAGGFALVLAGAKIWLEHALEPNFVVDRHPDHVVADWRR